MLRLAALFLAFACPLAAALPKPAQVRADVGGPAPVLSWDASEGAEAYRVAVFAAPDEEGKRELMSAVWVTGLSWAYGSPKVLAKVGKLRSETPKPLVAGAEYKVMVRAADAQGGDISEWVSTVFTAQAPGAPAPARSALPLSPTATASMTPTPFSTPTPVMDAEAATGPAELEVDLAAEFKETPELGEKGLAAAAALPSTAEGARALLQQGKADEAEAAYRALLDKQAASADLWEGLGDSYDARKMKVEAMEAYERALAIDGKRERLKKWMSENVKR